MTPSTSTPAAAAGSAAEDRGDPGPAEADLPGEQPPGPDDATPDIHLHAPPARLGESDARWLRARIAELLPLLPRPTRRVAVAVLDDHDMTRLHQRHLGRDDTTDVLTFEASTPQQPIDVDVAVGLDVAARSAAALGHDLRLELLLYVTHGLLHCAGHDDRDESAAAAMHAEEDRLLRAIGVGPVYRSGEAGS
jgi:rRNA maturation RNase YbeY